MLEPLAGSPLWAARPWHSLGSGPQSTRIGQLDQQVCEVKLSESRPNAVYTETSNLSFAPNKNALQVYDYNCCGH